MNISLTNRQFLNILLYDDIHYIFISMKIHKINVREHDSFEWFKLNFYIAYEFVDDIKIIAYFKRKVHIVDDLRVKLFINNDIFKLKLILIHLKQCKLIINNCEITAFVFIKIQNNWIIKIIRNCK